MGDYWLTDIVLEMSGSGIDGKDLAENSSPGFSYADFAPLLKGELYILPSSYSQMLE